MEFAEISPVTTMRILCISPFFPPTRDSEAFCSGKMVQALQQQGVAVTTLRLDAPYLRAKQDTSKLWDSLETAAFGIGDQPGRGRIRAVLCTLRYRTPVWPRWIDKVVRRAGELHRAEPFDLVYSRSLPMFSHIAGYWVSRKLNLPWVANINDPWDEHLFPGMEHRAASRWHAALSRYWLRKTLATADLVTFPCARLANYIVQLTEAEPRVEIIPHVGSRGPELERHEEFRLVHAGKLGTNEITGRSSSALLTGLRRFLDEMPSARAVTRLVLVGPEDPRNSAVIEELGLSSAVTNIGLVSYEESLRHIASASACVLIEGAMREGIYLPSKLADYIVAGKPVLALSPRVGTLSDLAGGAALTVVDQGDERQIQLAVRRLFESYQGQRLVGAPAELVEWFCADRIGKHFLKAVGDLPRARRAGLGRQNSRRAMTGPRALCRPAERAQRAADPICD
jgi:glycosyltransferase involved in cell wall biosynthesis